MSELEKESFIKRLAEKRSDEGVRPSNVFILENVSILLHPTYSYQIAPGYVKFSDDFLSSIGMIDNRNEEEELHTDLIRYISRIIRLARASPDEEVRKIIPANSAEFCCVGCGINHEARDFIRSLLINLIDRLEVRPAFARLLKENEFLTDESFDNMMHLSSSVELEQRSKEESKPRSIQQVQPEQSPAVMNEPKTHAITLRILCIQRDTVNHRVPFIGVNKEGEFFSGHIDRVHVRDEMVSNSMIKCMTNKVGAEQDSGYYVEISINDSIELLSDDTSFLKVSQLKSKIGEINTTKSDYILDVVILDGPYYYYREERNEQQEVENHEQPEKTFWATVGDETGKINLTEIGDGFLSTLNNGDKIRIIGALSTKDGIQLGHYGVIEKTGVLDYDSLERLRRVTWIIPPKKSIPIERLR